MYEKLIKCAATITLCTLKVTSSVLCVNICKFYFPFSLCSDQVCPSRSRLALRLKELAELMLLIPSIHTAFPTVAKTKCCINEESHSEPDWVPLAAFLWQQTQLLNHTDIDGRSWCT